LKQCLIANIGNKDVKLDGDEIPEPFFDGKQIYESYGAYKKRLSFPIINKIIQDNTYDEIYLVVSDQKEIKEREYRKKDTLYFGEIIKKAYCTESIELIHLHHNPAQYDETFDYYLKTFHKIWGLHKNEEWIYYLSLSGGTPAQNTASLYQGSMIFGEYCQPIYVTPSNVHRLKITNTLLRARALSNAKVSINRYEYSTAIDILKKYNFDSKSISYLEYADKRGKFQFKEALKMLSKIGTSFGAERILHERLKNEGKLLCKNDEAHLLLELSYLVKKYYHNLMYTEVFALLFRFIEGVLHFYVGKLTNISIASSDAMNTEDKRKRVISFIESDEELASYLTSENIQYSSNPLSRITLLGIVQYHAEKGKISTKIVGHIKKINSQSNKRNEGIYGHGHGSVSGIDPALIKSIDFLIMNIDSSLNTSFVYNDINNYVIPLLDDQI